IYIGAPLLSVLLLQLSNTPEISTLSLHDALPIFFRRATRRAATAPGRADGRSAGSTRRWSGAARRRRRSARSRGGTASAPRASGDRKSTRLNSSHLGISYAVFCLKKKTIHQCSPQ